MVFVGYVGYGFVKNKKVYICKYKVLQCKFWASPSTCPQRRRMDFNLRWHSQQCQQVLILGTVQKPSSSLLALLAIKNK